MNLSTLTPSYVFELSETESRLLELMMCIQERDNLSDDEMMREWSRVCLYYRENGLID